MRFDYDREMRRMKLRRLAEKVDAQVRAMHARLGGNAAQTADLLGLEPDTVRKVVGSAALRSRFKGAG